MEMKNIVTEWIAIDGRGELVKKVTGYSDTAQAVVECAFESANRRRDIDGTRYEIYTVRGSAGSIRFDRVGMKAIGEAVKVAAREIGYKLNAQGYISK